ncbi:MAG: 30S ribosomal protein S8 [Sphingomonadaceae bacterium]
MNLTDPIGDMLTRIRNATQARHDSVVVPLSREKLAVARVLKEEGFIRDFEMVREKNGKAARSFRIHLKYVGKKAPVLTGLKRVSKPGLRVYTGSKEIPNVYGGLGVAILSTPSGVMSGRKARQMNVGGEVLCYVW